VAGLFCAISLVVGYAVPRAFGVAEDQAIASSMEIGVHNAALAIFVAENVLDNVEIAVPAAVYSLLMIAMALAWGSLVSRRIRQARVSSAAT
jgi:bile acid:Na+ symporter, BASS family